LASDSRVILRLMGFQEKIGELLRLKDEGLLTQAEFDALVKQAREEESVNSVSLPPPETDTEPIPGDGNQTMSQTQTAVGAEGPSGSKKLAVAGIVVLVGVVGLVVFATRGDPEPTKSDKYKALVVEQKVLERELSSLEADVIKLKSADTSAQEKHDAAIKKLNEEKADWEQRAKNNKTALQELEALK